MIWPLAAWRSWRSQRRLHKVLRAHRPLPAIKNEFEVKRRLEHAIRIRLRNGGLLR